MTTKLQNNKFITETLSIAYAIIAALLIRTLLLELFFVPTGSMKATILEGDYIFATKYSYGYSKYSIPFSPNLFQGRILSSPPQRGDIIIFRPPHNMDIRYVKRLIGLPGDKIQIKDDLIYINDAPIERTEIGSYTSEQGRNYTKYHEVLPGGASYHSYKLKDDDEGVKPYHPEVFFVPEDMYFFLGDNRDQSADSRFSLGFVPYENFIAKGRFILFSTSKTLFSFDESIFYFPIQFWNWICSIRVERLFKDIHSL